MRIAFLLHLYQPENQNPAIIKEIAEKSYLPLIKLLKKTKNVKVTLNIPLSLLYLMDKQGYTTWLDDVKKLVEQEKIELVGSAAYHPLLTKVPNEIKEEQILLQEYGLGYYFGNHTGFEGENAIMIKNIRGFFPPEMAINTEVVDVLSDLGYSWVAVDENAVSHLPDSNYVVYKIKDSHLSAVVRSNSLSTYLAFMRDNDAASFVDACFETPVPSAIVALDGETFGHHNAEGISLFESILILLDEQDVKLQTISEFVSYEDAGELANLTESTWGASKKELHNGNVYPMWAIPDNMLHQLQWKIFEELLNSYRKNITTNMLGYENLKLWDDTALQEVEDEGVRNSVSMQIEFHKLLSSDQFWWASKKVMVDESILYHPDFIKASNNKVLAYVKINCEKAVVERISGIIDQLNDLLETENATENN